MGILGILWAIVVILFVVWLLGLILSFGGGFIHILLILAVILVIYNLIMHTRSRRV